MRLDGARLRPFLDAPTVTGRQNKPRVLARNGPAVLAVRAAVNSTIQGTAADLMKIAMIRLHKRIGELNLKTRLLIQVHDELVLEAPPEEVELAMSTIREAMERIPPFEVPLPVEVSSGVSWLKTKP